MGGKAHIPVTGHIHQSTDNTSVHHCPERNQASLTSSSSFSRVLSDICRFFSTPPATTQNAVFRKLSVPLWFSSLPRSLQIQSGTHLGHTQAGTGGRRGIQTPFPKEVLRLWTGGSAWILTWGTGDHLKQRFLMSVGVTWLTNTDSGKGWSLCLLHFLWRWLWALYFECMVPGR